MISQNEFSALIFLLICFNIRLNVSSFHHSIHLTGAMTGDFFRGRMFWQDAGASIKSRYVRVE